MMNKVMHPRPQNEEVNAEGTPILKMMISTESFHTQWKSVRKETDTVLCKKEMSKSMKAEWSGFGSSVKQVFVFASLKNLI